MSHFLVFVIGDDVEGQLAPYHEFECTGRLDEYVQKLDITEEMRNQYETSSREVVRFPDGSTANQWDDRFYRDPTEEETALLGRVIGSYGSVGGLSYSCKDWDDGRGSRPKIHDVTVGGGELVRLQTKDTQTFREYLSDETGKAELLDGDILDYEGQHKFGWIEVDSEGEVIKVIRNTNPFAKWDWWVVGGRWANVLPRKDGTTGSASTVEEIDFDGARETRRKEAQAEFKTWWAIFSQHGHPFSFQQMLDSHADKEEARKLYGEQESIKRFREVEPRFFGCPVQEYGFDELLYVERQVASVLVPYAVVMDRKWHARGEMGWFAMSSNEVERDDWAKTVKDILDSLPGDTLITVVDCHI